MFSKCSVKVDAVTKFPAFVPWVRSKDFCFNDAAKKVANANVSI